MGCLRGPCNNCGSMAKNGICHECKQEKTMSLADYICDQLRHSAKDWSSDNRCMIFKGGEIIMRIDGSIRLENPRIHFSIRENMKIRRAMRDHIVIKSSGYMMMDDSVVSLEIGGRKTEIVLMALNLAQLVFWWINS